MTRSKAVLEFTHCRWFLNPLCYWYTMLLTRITAETMSRLSFPRSRPTSAAISGSTQC